MIPQQCTSWVLTANHVVAQYAAMAAAKKRFADDIAQRDVIQKDPGLLSEQKRSRLRKLARISTQPPNGAEGTVFCAKRWIGKPCAAGVIASAQP